MSKYFVVKVVNDNPAIVSEWTELNRACVSFHDTCKTLWNASDVITATVKILNENLDLVGNKAEYITHPAPQPEPEVVEPTEPTE